MTYSRDESSTPPSHLARVRGCLLGGALGDALGAPVEFLSLAEIRNACGPDGATELLSAYGRVGAITDDTQMTLFTAEGLIRAAQRGRDRGICNPNLVLKHAYWGWLTTQGYAWESIATDGFEPGGWLIEERTLHSLRAPGNTCVAALRSLSGDLQARNDSKGCGGVMRSAPVGLTLVPDLDAFEYGCSFAAITHGHPTGQLASGAFALIVSRLAEGADLETSAIDALRRLKEEPEDRADETVRAVEVALAAAADTRARPPSAEVVTSLGRGWIAEEALAIGLYCALVADDFVHGVRLAVNHGGDSDSTGSITGNLLGSWWGDGALPEAWLEQLEAREIIERLARDFTLCFEQDEVFFDFEAYPSW